MGRRAECVGCAAKVEMIEYLKGQVRESHIIHAETLDRLCLALKGGVASGNGPLPKSDPASNWQGGRDQESIAKALDNVFHDQGDPAKG